MMKGLGFSLFVLLNLLSFIRPIVSSAQSSQIDLTGSWIERVSNYKIIDDRDARAVRRCTQNQADRVTIDGQDLTRGVEFRIVQKGNQLLIPDQRTTWFKGGRSGSYTMTNKGSISGNRIRVLSSGNLEGGYTAEGIGIISANGNTITGEFLCSGVRGSVTGRGTFTWTRDPRSEATIARLNPQVQPYARELVKKAALSGIQIKIINGMRTYKEQNALYCKGRNIPYCKGLYKPGLIVTNAKGGYSNHNFGIAFDIGIFDGNKYLPESPKYNEVGKIGKALGLEWGGDWQTIKDRPHFQLRPKWAANLSEKQMLEELRRRTEKNEPFYP